MGASVLADRCCPVGSAGSGEAGVTDFRPAIEVIYRDKPRRFVVRDAIDVVRFHIAKETGTILARSHVKGLMRD